MTWTLAEPRFNFDKCVNMASTLYVRWFGGKTRKYFLKGVVMVEMGSTASFLDDFIAQFCRELSLVYK